MSTDRRIVDSTHRRHAYRSHHRHDRRPDRRRRPHEVPMPPKLKTLLIWVVAIFLVYAIVTSPDRAADLVKALWDMITGAFASFGRFFASLTE